MVAKDRVMLEMSSMDPRSSSSPSSTFSDHQASLKAMHVGLWLLLCPLGSNIVIRIACCSIGIALPVYSTFKAIERKDQNEQ